jgi:hypothetical protein
MHDTTLVTLKSGTESSGSLYFRQKRIRRLRRLRSQSEDSPRWCEYFSSFISVALSLFWKVAVQTGRIRCFSNAKSLIPRARSSLPALHDTTRQHLIRTRFPVIFSLPHFILAPIARHFRLSAAQRQPFPAGQPHLAPVAQPRRCNQLSGNLSPPRHLAIWQRSWTS